MDPARNPYTPGAGTQPPLLAGREQDLEAASTLVRRVLNGKAQRSLMFYGLRGVGKTVLLNKIERDTESLGYAVVHIEVSQDDDFRAVIARELRRVLLEIDGKTKAKERVAMALRILKSFSVKLPEGTEFRLDIEPLVGTGDSGNLQADLVSLFVSVGEAAAQAAIPVAIVIDEAQYLVEDSFAALIASSHRISQVGTPLIVLCAGLPQIAGLAGDAKSYAERLFEFRPIGVLPRDEAVKAFVVPAKDEGMTFSNEIVDIALEATDGYPYFIQEYGHSLWNISSSESPTVEEAILAVETMTKSLDASFFKVRIDRATNAEKEFMFALGSLGPGPQKIANVADKMKRKLESISPVRGKLIHKGFIYPSGLGQISFTVPHFEKYLDRIKPTD